MLLTNEELHVDNIDIYRGDAISFYDIWDSPTVIISDGPYGVDGYSGDLTTPDGLGEWYEPHIKQWTEKSTYETTLWFWNTEIGWATVHPFLKKYGWEYKACNVWNKGIGHIAGNVNSKSIRHFPIVTEVCVQYYKNPSFHINNKQLSMKEWLRHEWERSGLSLNKTNEACGVINAATRKYFTLCDLWYFPPADKMELLINYANKYGQESGKPYFSLNGKQSLTKEEWEKMRTIFKCPHSFTNVWDEPPVNGNERLRNGTKALHSNQKPLNLMRLIIEASSNKSDVIWEPFGGLFSGLIASKELNRRGYGAEISQYFFEFSKERIKSYFSNKLELPSA